MSRQNFHTIERCRLEVKIPPTGPSNLVVNPSGELGAWGWITPGASYMRRAVGAANILEHVSTTDNSVFTTEPMPMTAGHYAAAAVSGPGDSLPVSARFEWLDAAGTLLSMSPVSALFYLYVDVSYNYAPVLAPANTRFMRLRFEQASALGVARLTNVVVASAPTAAGLGSQRTNLAKNPTVTADGTPWTPGPAPSTVAVGATAFTGATALTVARSEGSGAGPATGSAFVPGIIAGRDYTLQARMKANAAGQLGTLTLDFFPALPSGISEGSAADTPIGITTTLTPRPVLSSTEWGRYAITQTAPAGATRARLTVGGEVTYIGFLSPVYADAIMVSEGTDVPNYFDGTFTNAAWTGVANQSSSVYTDTTLGSLPPPVWRNILGPTHSISTSRESLNIGLMEAELLDATLDPATSATLRPGGGVRLTALVSGVWEPVFVGTIDRLVVQYDDKRRPIRPPRVSMTAVDNTRWLSGARRTQGVAAVADLPFVLEGAGVPWSVNGVVDQLQTNPTAVSLNDNATALDQIALTRDSNAAHAWVNRKGVCVVTTATGASIRTLTEPRYSDLEVAFSSEECINAVEIEGLAIVDGRTESTLYGPYEDAPSIAQWRRRPRKFTVHGLTPAAIATLGATILTRNANPGITVRSVTLPMRTVADLDADGARDLGEIVTVSNTARALAPTLRVTGVKHRIESEPAKWITTLTFTGSGSVASPSVAPEVQNAKETYPINVPAAASFTSGSQLWRDGRTVTIKVDTTSTAAVGGSVPMAVIPLGHRPPAGLYFAVADSATGAITLLLVTSTGNICRVFAQSSGVGTLGCFTYQTNV